MSDKDSNWRFAEEFGAERDDIAQLRRHSLELGVEPISPATGAALAVIAASTSAATIIEVGTGVGVSSLWMLKGAPEATLTSIDLEAEYQQTAKKAILESGSAASRIRMIAGRARDMLPRMNEKSYDIVLVDADPQSVIEYVEHGLRLVRAGGSVLVPHALWRGRVADPAQRDDVVSGFRTLLKEVSDSEAVLSSVSPVGDGLLHITKLS